MGGVKIAMSNYKQQIKAIQSLKKKSETAIKRTISDVRNRAPGWIAQEVVSQYNIKSTEIKPTKKGKVAGSISVRGDTVDTLQIIYKGRALTPTHFAMAPTRPTKLLKKQRQLVKANGLNVTKRNPKAKNKDVAFVRSRRPYDVSFEVIKGKRRTLHGKYPTPPFLAPAAKGSSTMIPFQRTVGGKWPVDAVKTISMPQMVSSIRTQNQINQRLDTEINKLIAKNVKPLEK